MKNGAKWRKEKTRMKKKTKIKRNKETKWKVKDEKRKNRKRGIREKRQLLNEIKKEG